MILFLMPIMSSAKNLFYLHVCKLWYVQVFLQSDMFFDIFNVCDLYPVKYFLYV